MSKVLLISNSSTFSKEIVSELSSTTEVLLFKYDFELLSSFVNNNKIDLVLLHFYSLSNEDVICFHKILTGEIFTGAPKVFLGDEINYRDHVSTWGGHFAGVILTPIVLSDLHQKIEQFLNQILKPEEKNRAAFMTS